MNGKCGAQLAGTEEVFDAKTLRPWPLSILIQLSLFHTPPLTPATTVIHDVKMERSLISITHNPRLPSLYQQSASTTDTIVTLPSVFRRRCSNACCRNGFGLGNYSNGACGGDGHGGRGVCWLCCWRRNDRDGI
ncbi:unnamed protein product [Lactuca virosa]|uniref:Uncharacterized protein n=1 Tax=Lactuca virosa TaxID=75947 RepID=A0AAU9MPZ0_9ASTR|nr:unnamed protein product [Lactuca virosa]